MGIIAVPLGYVLTWIYNIVGSYGISLIILTVLVKCLLYPLYFKQTKSMGSMMAVQPRMQEIQEKYKNDPTRMNQELQKLYEEEHFNPLGGCLPMVIQMPFLFGIFALLRNPVEYLHDPQMLFAVHESFLWIDDLGQPDLWILPILSGVATFISFSMTQQLTSVTETAQQQKSMNIIMKYVFPISLLVLARSYPAGLAIYWAGGQILQIFFNIRMSKYRRKMMEEQQLAQKRRKAEKQLAKMKKARLAKVKG